jgi:hypothetical protein
MSADPRRTKKMEANTLARAIVCASVSIATIGALPAEAQDRRVEVTPFVSMGSPGSSRVGAAVAFPVARDFSVEAEVGFRNGEGGFDALSSSVNLLYQIPGFGRVRPYLAGGVGLQEFGTAIHVPGHGVVPLKQIAFTVNAGGGVKVPVTNHWGFRSDVRWSNGFGRYAGENWRLYNGVTLK